MADKEKTMLVEQILTDESLVSEIIEGAVPTEVMTSEDFFAWLDTQA